MNKPQSDAQIRPSAIAGTWYPGDASTLSATIDEFLKRVPTTPPADELVALISPHAGYAFSGQTAGRAYAQLCHQKFDTVVLIGPSHYADFGPFAISAKKYYATPLGKIELDQEFISRLTEQIPLTRVEHDHEHSLEIQLPFLQRVLGVFKLVPIMMSHPFYIVGPEARADSDQLASVLAEIAQGNHVLLVASSDLSHIDRRDDPEAYASVRKFDARFAQLIEKFDMDTLADYMWRTGNCRACGDAPIITTLLAAKKLGADRVQLLHQTNSADVTSEREHAMYVVGYLAAGVYKSAKAKG